MNSKERKKRILPLELLSIAVLIICAIMIFSYFFNFHDGFSDDYEKWGSFGDYFGSITGLLAFLGVLYSLIQSNKATLEAQEETKKAVEEGLRREERDLFFKLLELDRQQFETVIFSNEHKKCSGLEAFEIYNKLTNKILSNFSIYDCIVKLSISDWDNLGELNPSVPDIESKCKNNIISTIQTIYKKEFTRRAHYETISKSQVEIALVQDYLTKFYLDKNFYFDVELSNLDYHKKYEDNLFEYSIIYDLLKIKVSSYEIYKAVQIAGNVINSKYGKYVGQFIRNLYYILLTIKNFKYNNDYYFKLYRAQLSRTECLFLLFVAVSDKSSNEFVELLIDNDILDEIYYKDFFFTQIAENWEDNEQTIISAILQEYLDENNN